MVHRPRRRAHGATREIALTRAVVLVAAKIDIGVNVVKVGGRMSGSGPMGMRPIRMGAGEATTKAGGSEMPIDTQKIGMASTAQEEHRERTMTRTDIALVEDLALPTLSASDNGREKRMAHRLHQLRSQPQLMQPAQKTTKQTKSQTFSRRACWPKRVIRSTGRRSSITSHQKPNGQRRSGACTSLKTEKRLVSLRLMTTTLETES